MVVVAVTPEIGITLASTVDAVVSKTSTSSRIKRTLFIVSAPLQRIRDDMETSGVSMISLLPSWPDSIINPNVSVGAVFFPTVTPNQKEPNSR